MGTAEEAALFSREVPGTHDKLRTMTGTCMSGHAGSVSSHRPGIDQPAYLRPVIDGIVPHGVGDAASHATGHAALVGIDD
jgi:hypothetical protein